MLQQAEPSPTKTLHILTPIIVLLLAIFFNVATRQPAEVDVESLFREQNPAIVLSDDLNATSNFNDPSPNVFPLPKKSDIYALSTFNVLILLPPLASFHSVS